MTPKSEVQRRLRERRKLGLVAVSVGTPHQGTVRGAIPPQRAAQVRQWIEEAEEKRDD
jgi:hypothetical protein